MAVTSRVRIPRRGVVGLTGQQLATATKRAYAAALRKGTSEARKRLRVATGLPARAVKNAVERKRDRIRAEGAALNLINFGARSTRRGVSARPWGKRRNFPGLFIVNAGQGGGYVARRDPTRQNPSRPGPLNAHTAGVEPVYGPSIAKEAEDVFADPEWRAMVLDAFERRFEQQSRFLRGRR